MTMMPLNKPVTKEDKIKAAHDYEEMFLKFFFTNIIPKDTELTIKFHFVNLAHKYLINSSAIATKI